MSGEIKSELGGGTGLREGWAGSNGASRLGLVVETERGLKIKPFNPYSVRLPVGEELSLAILFIHVTHEIDDGNFRLGGRLIVPSGDVSDIRRGGQVVCMDRVVGFYDPYKGTNTGTVFVDCKPLENEEVADMFDWRVTVLPEAMSESSWRGSYSAQLRDLRTRVELVGAERMSDFAKLQTDIGAHVKVEPIQLRHDKGLGQVDRVNFPYNLFSQEFDVSLKTGGEGSVVKEAGCTMNWGEWQKKECVPLQFGSEQVVIPLKELQLSPNEMGSYRIQEMIQMAGEIENSEAYIVLVPVVQGDDRSQKYLAVFATRDELQPSQLKAVERYEAEEARKQEFERQVAVLTEKVEFIKPLTEDVLKFRVDGVVYGVNVRTADSVVKRIRQKEGKIEIEEIVEPVVKAACVIAWRKRVAEIGKKKNS